MPAGGEDSTVNRERITAAAAAFERFGGCTIARNADIVRRCVSRTQPNRRDTLSVRRQPVSYTPLPSHIRCSRVERMRCLGVARAVGRFCLPR